MHVLSDNGNSNKFYTNGVEQRTWLWFSIDPTNKKITFFTKKVWLDGRYYDFY